MSSSAGSEGDPVPDLSECDTPEPCATVSEQLGELIIPPTDEALRCVIQALYDRTPGLYMKSTTVAGLSGGSTTTLVVLVKDDGSVHTISKSSGGTGNPRQCSLLPATDYDACLASTSTDTWATSECRSVAWVIDCMDADVTCE